MHETEGKILFLAKSQRWAERKGISCIRRRGILEVEGQREERVPLWIHFRCGESSLGPFINDVFSFLCSIEDLSLRGG